MPAWQVNALVTPGLPVCHHPDPMLFTSWQPHMYKSAFTCASVTPLWGLCVVHPAMSAPSRAPSGTANSKGAPILCGRGCANLDTQVATAPHRAQRTSASGRWQQAGPRLHNNNNKSKSSSTEPAIARPKFAGESRLAVPCATLSPAAAAPCHARCAAAGGRQQR